MPTKAFHRFVQRVEVYRADLELCDLLLRGFSGLPNSQKSIVVALGGAEKEHPILARRINTQQSRTVCGGHLKRTLQAAFIKDLYEDFYAYLSTTMARAALAGVNPVAFAGDIKFDINATDILAAGDWDRVVKLISDAVFRRLEGERNTRTLISKASTLLGLQIDKAKLDAAMPYLAARHMLVHCDGIPNDHYRQCYRAIAMKAGKILIDDRFVADAARDVSDLALDIDRKIIAAKLVRPQDMT